MAATMKSNWPLVAKLILVAFSWLYLLAVTHHFLHERADWISTALTHPVQKFIAAFLALSVIIYLVIWSLPRVQRPSWRGFITISLWSMLIIIGHGVTHTGEANAEELLNELQEMMGVLGFALLACSYALFLAMPFVAGVEIGLLIMTVFGIPGVIVAYCGTLIGLNLAFFAGRILPASAIQRLFNKLHIKTNGQDFDSLLESLVSRSNWLSKVGKRLLNNRYLTLAVGLNFPGNSLVGGGGGLSLMAGISRRLIYWPYFVLVTGIATLPIPLMVLLGLINLDKAVEHSGWFHGLLVDMYVIFPLF